MNPINSRYPAGSVVSMSFQHDDDMSASVDGSSATLSYDMAASSQVARRAVHMSTRMLDDSVVRLITWQVTHCGEPTPDGQLTMSARVMQWCGWRVMIRFLVFEDARICWRGTLELEVIHD